MTEPLPALIAHLEQVPPDTSEVRMDGETFRAVMWHLKQSAEYVEIPRMALGKQP